ncbi:uncharacterized protein LDX57_006990 [Aspergillus melleus]|uniref:uncharacterized protein n=1 Tax=Aspergillus melleus TaxID=138277 RepID=UPI001E8E1D15|nr:uncharacterized protein LDX57_006990 [Aspergillus melleus]KAH8429323.1 hypothetical protein LDX57_006990 [Aspergillus melleus]
MSTQEAKEEHMPANASDANSPKSTIPQELLDETGGGQTEDDGDVASERSGPGRSLKQASILYSVQVFENASDLPITFKSDRPPPFEAKRRANIGNEEGEEQTVFEVVTDVVGGGNKSRMEAFSQWELGEDVGKLEVKEILKTRIEIYSQVLLEAIRSVVSYYPGQNLAGDVVTIHQPYPVLIHHRHELRALQAAEESPEDVRSKHIRLLFEFLDPFIDRVIAPEERRYKKPTPAATFDNLWLLFKPGTFVYETYKSKPIVHCVISMQEITMEDGDNKGRPAWELYAWNIVATQDKVGRNGGYSNIQRFEGEKAITSLASVPLEYMSAIDGYVPNLSLSPVPPRPGDQARFERDKYYRGLVIIDPASALTLGKVGDVYGWYFDGECKDQNFIGENPSAESGTVSQWESFDNIAPDQFENLTDDHYVLASPVMAAFGLKDKTWGVFEVECFREIQREELQKPILPQGDIEVIEALAYRQENMQKAWRPDFIQDKGEGQIILLHGPPGVGKTYTVEWIAMTTSRPLLSLTIADIGTEEHSIEGELMKWFYFAETWNAILLIDEADIFLERRSNYDLARNGIVSVFLRQMEYFRGILFLTTNRVGHIDDAFLSRVHVVLEYKSLDGDMSNRIWEAFFAKLQRDMKGKFIIHSQAKRFILQRKEGSEVQWSGREIRNTLQTAVALAEYEASKEEGHSDDDPVIVVTEHFKQVMQMSRAFRNYMTSVHAGTELKRAQLNRDRNDSFQDRS